MGELEKTTLFLSKSGRDPTAMGQRRVTQAKGLGKLKSEHGYSNGTGIEVIQEILSLISLRGSVYQVFQTMSL